MKILITGAAGFIGMHSSLKFLNSKFTILGIDNLNNYYDRNLKLKRLKLLKKNKRFKFKKIDISNFKDLSTAFKEFKPDFVLHLAAQAGVRHSIIHPEDYTKSNLVGFANILECSKNCKIKHLIFASSSSVYGDSAQYPLSEEQKLNSPISYYAATKLSNELMAHSYSYIHRLPSTGLRFFTVYGPWGRPDMALFLFTDAIKNNKKIKLFNSGNMVRDFTYVDDIVDSIFKLIKKIPKKIDTKKKKQSPFRVLNIGSNNPINIKKYIKYIEYYLNKKAKKINYPMQKGDVKYTHADLKKLKETIKLKKTGTKLQTGIHNFIKWYNKYYGR
jgi:UDP-glucuronate 4-epimerase|tara:strand:- start:3144 stop:4133 length:990 start_codon:yes stop_codon:yes gene_type:complete